jgi:hypothetical protein
MTTLQGVNFGRRSPGSGGQFCTPNNKQALQAERVARLQAEQRAQQGEYDAIVNAIAASTSDAENAQRDYAYYSSINDHSGMSDAQRRIARAESRLVQLESGRDAWDTREQQQQQPVQQQMTTEQLINSMPLMPEEREWLLKHQHLVTNQASITELQGAFNASQRLGLQRGSQEYLNFIAERVGADAAGAAGLTKEQVEHAKYSGVPLDVYAENARKLAALKARGFYSQS